MAASVPVKPITKREIPKTSADSKSYNEQLFQNALNVFAGDSQKLLGALKQITGSKNDAAELIERLKKSIANLQNELGEKESRMIELDQNNEKLRQKLKVLKENSGKYESTINNDQAVINELASKLNSSCDKIQMLQKDNQSLQMQLQKRNQLIEQYQQEYIPVDTYNQLLADFDQIKLENSELNDLLTEAGEQIEQLIIQKDKGYEDLMTIIAQNSLLQNDINDLQSQNEHLENEMSQLSQKVQDQDETIQDLQNQLQLKLDLKETNDMGTQTIAQNDNLMKEARIAIREFNAMKFANAMIMEQMIQQKGQYQQEIKTLKTQVDENKYMKQNYSKLTKQLEQYKNKVDQLEDSVSNLESMLLKKQQDNELLLKSIESMEALIENQNDSTDTDTDEEQ